MGGDPETAVRELWARLAARDWDGCADVLAPDVVVEWPASGERFCGRDAYLGVNRAYPEGWSTRVVAVVADGSTVVSEVEVPLDGVGIFAVMSIWTVESGRITRGREYWITVNGDEPPAWRAAYHERFDGRPSPLGTDRQSTA